MFKIKTLILSLLILSILTGCQSVMNGTFISEDQKSQITLTNEKDLSIQNKSTQYSGEFSNIIKQNPQAAEQYENNDYYAQVTVSKDQLGLYPDPLVEGNFIALLEADKPYQLCPLSAEDIEKSYTIEDNGQNTTISWEMLPYQEGVSKLGEQIYYNAIALGQGKVPNLNVTITDERSPIVLTLGLPETYTKKDGIYLAANGDFFTLVEWPGAYSSFQGIYYRQGDQHRLQITSIQEDNYTGALPSFLYDTAKSISSWEVDTSAETLLVPFILSRNKDYLGVNCYYPGENYNILYSKN